jgi:hypothetical protein
MKTSWNTSIVKIEAESSDARLTIERIGASLIMCVACGNHVESTSVEIADLICLQPIGLTTPREDTVES